MEEEEDYCYDDNDYYIDEEDGGIEQDSSVFVEAPSFKILTTESLLAAQREYLRPVMECLSLREHHVRTLLIHHRWDTEKLFAALVEKGESYLFTAAGVTVVRCLDMDSPLTPSVTVTCDICMEDVSGDKATRMECGHCFCNDCWTEHFIVKINEGESKFIRCMAHKCNAICVDDIVRNLVKARDPSLAEKFDRFLLTSYIEDNKKVKWCPSTPNCGNAIQAEETRICEVECSCGQQFCFSCSSEAHSPCSCLMWELWSRRCADEPMTINWIQVHTKPCPTCQKPVQKDGGCNLVTCRCGQPFCWLCGAATGMAHTWTSISGHSCGRYKKEDVEKIERAKFDLNRYIHYYDRYKAHKDSLKLEAKLKQKIVAKVEVSEEKESALRDFSWVTNGASRLFRSRKVLSYSYPFAYYMFGEELFPDEMTKKEREMRQSLFEDLQQQLESTVEKLSKFLEEPFDEYPDQEVLQIRMQVVNLTAAIDVVLERMYEDIESKLLGSLRFSTHKIASYKSGVIEKALDIGSHLTIEANDTEDHLHVHKKHGCR